MRERENGVDLLVVAVGLAVLAALAFFALFGIGRQLWLDDTHSTYHAFQGVGGVVDSLRTDSHPPLYFLLLSVWMTVGGLDEAWLRVPSIVFYLLGGLVLLLYGRRVGDVRLGALAAALYWFNPVVLGHMHGVRPYSLVGLLSVCSTVWYVQLVFGEGAKRRHWVGYIALNVLGTFTHYWFAFLLAGQVAGALLFARRESGWKLTAAVFVSAVPFAVFWTPVLLKQLQGSPTSWMTAPGGWAWVSAPLQLLGGADPYDFRLLAVAFYLLVAFVCFVRPGMRPVLIRWPELRRLFQDPRVGLLLTAPAVLMALTYLASQWRPIYHVRYTIVGVPALALLLALGLSRLGDRRLVPVVVLLLVVTSVALRDDVLSLELALDNRAATEYIIERAAPGDEVLHIALNYAPTTHYLRSLAPGRVFRQRVFPGEVREHPGWRDQERLLADRAALANQARDLADSLLLASGSGRVWLMADFGTDSVLTEIAVGVLEQDFVLDDTVPMDGWFLSEIRAYSRKP